LLVLLAVYFFYISSIAEDRPGGRWLALGLLVAAMFAHAEAALLLPALGLAVLAARGLRWTLRPGVVVPFALGTGGALAVVFGPDWFGGNLGTASHLEAIHEVRPYLSVPTSGLLSGIKGFAPAFVDWWRLPFTLIALVGLVYLLKRPERLSCMLYLYLVLGVTLLELFFLAGPTWQVPRYAFMLLPLYWLIAGGVLGRWLRWRPAWWGAGTALALAVCIGLVGYRTAFTPEWGYDRAFRYLQEAWQPGDVVLTTNPPASALYLNQADYYAMQYGNEEYVMPGSGGAKVDRWVGAPLLDSEEQLREILATAPRVWLVVDGWRFQSRFGNEFIRTVLDQMSLAFDEAGMAVFVGEGYKERSPPVVIQPLDAEFGLELALEGYELSTDRLQPGGKLDVSLHWRALEAPRTAYTVFLHLIGPGSEGSRVAQRDELLLGGYYQPTVWPQDETVLDRHVLELPEDLAPGRYRLEMGLYPPDGMDSALPLAEGWEPVVLDHLIAGEAPSPSPEVPLDADFGGLLRLMGYSLTCEGNLSACRVRLFWQATEDLRADYTVFVHLAGEDGRLVGQHDGMPEDGFFPTSAWDPGEVVVDEHQFDIDLGAPAGDYQLRVGLYRLETGERLPVRGSDGQRLGDQILLTTITIPSRD
jgi:hypothetical protein